MKKYVLSRLLRSIISILLVTTISFIMVYSLVPREEIFLADSTYTKLKAKPDELKDYENNQYMLNGYIDYYNPAQLCSVVAGNEADYDKCIKNEDPAMVDAWFANNKGWVKGELPIAKSVFATREIPTLERVGRFYKNFLKIDHPWRVNDPSNPDLNRGLGFSASSEVGLAITCEGCEFKNQLYVNTSFPFIHQNFIKLNLGKSYPTFQGQDVMSVISSTQGKPKVSQVEFETGKVASSPMNLGTCSYKPTGQLDRLDKERFVDNYAECKNNNNGPSMLATSGIMGLIAVAISYGIGVPLGVVMARKKGLLVDRLGVALITVLISVPSLAFIYFFRFVGSTVFGLPDAFPTLGATNPVSYIMPTIILGLLSLSGLVIWIRRYMIDQHSADYVKFAKAKGLSEKEISKNHIFRNAIIPISNAIPTTIIASISGATITETIFAIPGMGKMLPDAIIQHNHALVIGLVFIFTTLSILSVFLGDLLLAKVDPRINLAQKGGK